MTDSGLRAALHRRRERIRGNPAGNAGYRIGVAVVGVGIMLVGFPLIPLPGPGWLVVFLGLGVLASEFGWASRLQRFGLGILRRWTGWVTRRSRAVQALLGVATAAVVALAGWAYLAVTGVPGWLPDAVARLLGRLPGV